MQKTALIIGASRGLGLGLAKQFCAAGWQVIATVRNPQHAEALSQIPQVRVETLDMDDAGSVDQLAARLAGRTLGEAAVAMRRELASGRSQLDAASRDLVERGLAVWSEDAARRPVLIVRGAANLLDESAVSDIERVRQLLDDLENTQSVAELLDSAREAEATRIFIGSENRLFALSGSSVIASPYRDRDGRVVGVLGVIGPTRLNYARVVPMVDFTARSLGKLIG